MNIVNQALGWVGTLSPVGILFAIVGFAIVITVIVFVHEFGHFIVARWCGVKVKMFSVGFGREVFGFTDRHGTRWRLAALPLGGFVRFLGDENEASVPDQQALAQLTPEERRGAFPAKTVGQRAAIVFAGPAFNFILAIVVFAFIAVIFGRQDVVPRIDSVKPGSVAAAAGFQPGDVIRSVDGKPIAGFGEADLAIKFNAGQTLHFVVDRNGRELGIDAAPEARDEQDQFGNQQRVGALDIDGPPLPARIGAVAAQSPAGEAGLQPGDLIRAVDGVPIANFEALRQIVATSPDKPLSLTVDGRADPVEVTPTHVTEQGKVIGRLGIVADSTRDPADQVAIRYSPLGALVQGANQTWSVVDQTAQFFAQLVTGRQSLDQLGGPLRVAQVAGQVARQSWDDQAPQLLIALIGFVSISIGLMNLLPIPMLDGGHLLFYGIEAVRGKPLSERIQEIGFRIGFTGLVMLMLFVTFNDLRHLLPIFGGGPPS